MRTLGIAVLLVLVVAAGCNPGPTLPPPAAAIPVDVTEVRFDALDAALKERKGKVVLVDFWATWCGPCRSRFPHFVETHKKYADRGLVCMSVSLDKLWPQGRTYDRAKVLTFLQDKDATFPNFVVANPDDEEKIAKRFGLGRSIPFMALFNKEGKKVWDREEEPLSDSDLDKLIEVELAK